MNLDVPNKIKMNIYVREMNEMLNKSHELGLKVNGSI